MLNIPPSSTIWWPFLGLTVQPSEELLSVKSHSTVTFNPLLCPQFVCIYKVSEIGYHSIKEGISLENLQILFSQGLIP
jgi:hypothetical protein